MTTRLAFLDLLADYGTRARRQALSYVPFDASEYLVEPASDYLHRGGKGLRPALCLAACEAFGGRLDAALPTAAAIELFHTAFLVHDDVEDDSQLRRGAPTLHRLHGSALAINAGDGLAFFALAALRDNERTLGWRTASRIWSEFDLMARHTVEGQAMELGWRRDGRTDLTADDYLDLIIKKTCWYTTILPLRVGTVIAAGTADLAAMVRFGFFLGAAFQIRDDILNLTGDPDAYGKERLGDLREGKRTLMLLHLLAAAAPDDRRWLETFLSEPDDAREAQAERVYDMMQDYGSVGFADQFARGIADLAVVAFDRAFAGVPDSDARRFIRHLVAYMVERDR